MNQGGAGKGSSRGSSLSGGGGDGRGTLTRLLGADSRNVLSLFVVAVLFTGIAVGVLGARGRALAGIAANGRTTTGVVTNAIELTRSGSKSYELEYQFRVAGVTYNGIKPVEREEAVGARRGQPLTVTYDAADPNHNIATPLADAQQNTRLASFFVWPLAALLWASAFWKLTSSRKGT